MKQSSIGADSSTQNDELGITLDELLALRQRNKSQKKPSLTSAIAKDRSRNTFIKRGKSIWSQILKYFVISLYDPTCGDRLDQEEITFGSRSISAGGR